MRVKGLAKAVQGIPDIGEYSTRMGRSQAITQNSEASFGVGFGFFWTPCQQTPNDRFQSCILCTRSSSCSKYSKLLTLELFINNIKVSLSFHMDAARIAWLPGKSNTPNLASITEGQYKSSQTFEGVVTLKPDVEHQIFTDMSRFWPKRCPDSMGTSCSFEAERKIFIFLAH